MARKVDTGLRAIATLSDDRALCEAAKAVNEALAYRRAIKRVWWAQVAATVAAAALYLVELLLAISPWWAVAALVVALVLGPLGMRAAKQLDGDA